MSNENVTKSAVEVVATFGDAVVGVRHLTDPQGGKVRAATKALLAGGAALLAASAITFGWAANVAAENEAGLKAWKALGKPAWAYRPHMIPVGLDAICFGGSFLGIGALAWGLSRRKSEKNPARVSLGTAAGCDFPMEGVGSSFDLIAPMGDGFAVNVAPAMTGAPAGTIPVSPTTKLRLKLGATQFLIQSVAAPKKNAAAGFTFDRRVAAFFAASAAAHLGVLALLKTVPSDQDTAASDDDSIENVLASAELDSRETKPIEPSEEEFGSDATGEAARTAMALVEGTMGTDQANGDPGQRKVMKRSDRPSISREEAIERAKASGLFMSDSMQGGFDSFTGDSDLTSGLDSLDFDGGWEGDGSGSPQGFGNGRRGFGPGGGGNDWNSIWSGAYNTIPGGDGFGDDYSFDKGPRGPRKHTQTHPVTKFCQTTECKVSGDVDPAVIRRYMKRNAAKISYCYEKELLSSPGLQGTVATRFTVTPDGRVSSVDASGVNENVSSCIAGVISNIKFPAFKSPFEVKYPFHVHPAGH
jgi:hypothetical protein